MGNQPISKQVLEKHPELNEPKPFYTILFDMHSLMKTSMVDKRLNSKGEIYGMVFQTILKIKILLGKKDFQHVYAMYDGINSGQLAIDQGLIEYKSNRQGKNFDFGENNSEPESDYYKEMDKFMRKVLDNKKKPLDPQKVSEQQSFFDQKKIIMEMLEELGIRQLEYKLCEGDSLLGYYVQHKLPNERIVIVSSDLDLAQLISDSNFVCVYNLRLSVFLSEATFKKNYLYPAVNILTQKLITGDNSDCVHGCKGVGLKTLHEIMPELLERPVSVDEIVERAKLLSEERVKNKLKEKKALYNIINQVTDGSHKEGQLYSINKNIMDLTNPLLTDEAIEGLEEMMYSPLDMSDRSLSNLYKLMIKYNIDELLNENKFSSFFSTFSGLRDKEIKFYDKWVKDNN